MGNINNTEYQEDFIPGKIILNNKYKIEDLYKNTTMNSPTSVLMNFCNKNKVCKFNTKVNVILIPSRDEYISNNLNSLLWWEEDDYIFFREEYKQELLKNAYIIKDFIVKYIKKKNGTWLDSSESSDSDESIDYF
tara:strand:- start:6166 stop:6570 length:405 start_codon:yes stop_codon:yes gene_type:complete